jgi:hypothetical protein
MPFCPKCRYEYKEGIAECPDCKVGLVAELPPMPEETPDDVLPDVEWVALARLTSNSLAEMVVEGLRAKNIKAIIHSGVGYFGFAGTQGLASFAPVGGGYSILVAADRIEDAVAEAKVLLGDNWDDCKFVDIDPQQERNS